MVTVGTTCEGGRFLWLELMDGRPVAIPVSTVMAFYGTDRGGSIVHVKDESNYAVKESFEAAWKAMMEDSPVEP